MGSLYQQALFALSSFFKLQYFFISYSIFCHGDMSLLMTVCYGMLLFTVRRYASVVYAMALCLSVCLSQDGVLLKRLNVGSRKQHHPHNSPGTLVFLYQKSSQYSTGFTPYGGTKCRWGGLTLVTFDK